MIAIFRRDLMAYFNSAMAWILMAVYLFVVGLIYGAMVKNFSEKSMMAGMGPFGSQNPNIMDELITPYVWWMGFLMMFVLPLLTMRLIAEERRTGTLEMLFTYPLSDLQIVMGKFFAAMAVVILMLTLTMGSILALNQKAPLEWSLVGTGYAGLVLVAASFIAFGLWASSLTASQLIAAVITYGGLMMMWLMQVVDELIPWAKERFGALSIMEHLENMVRGNMSSHDLVYYVAWISLFLYLTCRVLESRKWST